MKDVLLAIALVGDSGVIAVPTVDAHLIWFEPCLDSEGASGPALARKAVTDGDRERITRHFQT